MFGFVVLVSVIVAELFGDVVKACDVKRDCEQEKLGL